MIIHHMYHMQSPASLHEMYEITTLNLINEFYGLEYNVTYSFTIMKKRTQITSGVYYFCEVLGN
jgi:hypothetical protein